MTPSLTSPEDEDEEEGGVFSAGAVMVVVVVAGASFFLGNLIFPNVRGCLACTSKSANPWVQYPPLLIGSEEVRILAPHTLKTAAAFRAL